LVFTADLVMQSFCHTAAYPKPVDVTTHHTLPDFIMNRGGVSLRPGDGVIHSWLNRMLLPDTVGTGGLSYPLDWYLPGRFWSGGLCRRDRRHAAGYAGIGAGSLQRQDAAGITLRDLVHAIPLYAIKQGLLTVEKRGKTSSLEFWKLKVCRI
jgi:aconitate hydratase 2/2-methylisocitrate dehydratase